MSIVVDQLKKSFNSHVAVDGVSFSVGAGEFVTLLGPSGSGKSTMLRCIAGLEIPDAGRIEVNGEDVTAVSVQDRKIGFVFQHYALFRHMSVLDNIAFGLRVRGVKKSLRRARAAELVNLFELAGFENRFPHQLSGGQRQRVALARALAPEPGLLLLDEPFGALDARLRRDLRVWLRKMHERVRLTTIMVTHDQEEALELSDRILVIHKGKVEQDAPPPDIFNKPQTEFVATFVGETYRMEGIAHDQLIRSGPFEFWAPHVPNGARASVLFRPSDVYVTSHFEAGSVLGTIAAVQFLGATDNLEIDLEGGIRIQAHVPKGVAEQSRFGIGKKVYVTIAAAHVFELTHS